ncbi:MAG TPA: MarR family transcriptional regulator [bacterium]|nr:MarR family transcriptional regulator [bacterium]
MKKKIEKLAENLADFHPVFHKAFSFKPPEEVMKYCLTIPHLVLFGMLKNSQPKLSEVAQYLSVSPAMVTHIVDDLERKKLIRRISGGKDRRVKRLALTAEGKKLIMRLRENKISQISRLMEKLAPRDLKTFMKAITDIMDIFSSYGNNKNDQAGSEQ